MLHRCFLKAVWRRCYAETAQPRSFFEPFCLHAQLLQLTDNLCKCRTLAGLCCHAPAGHSFAIGKVALASEVPRRSTVGTASVEAVHV